MMKRYVMVLALVLVGCSEKAAQTECVIAPPEAISKKYESAQKIGFDLSRLTRIPVDADVENKLSQAVSATFREIPEKQAACQLLGQLLACVKDNAALASKVQVSVDKACFSLEPPPKRIRFNEDFTLGEKDSFVSKHGVTVKVGDIYSLEGRGVLANVGASPEGPVEYLDSYSKGAQISLARNDCDSLLVVVRDIELSWPSSIPREDLLKMGPGAERFITRKVTGSVSGKCEE